MTARKNRAGKPLGRPPATTSAETNQRILDAARRCFAEFGYDKTTNQRIADQAEITTGAIYHYYDSKQQLFAAVADEVNRRVVSEFTDAIVGVETFPEQITAILERAMELHRKDRSMAVFSSTFPLELRRHPEVTGSIQREILLRPQKFFRAIVKKAHDRGELRREVDVEAVVTMIASATIGFAYLGAIIDDFDAFSAAIRAFERLVDGDLIVAPAKV